MNNRINAIFLKKKKKLITFVTGGDPDFKSSLKIIKQLPTFGVDIIEIGMPFSDPMADGPTIQLSSLRAIKKNINLKKIFEICKKFRESNNKTPVILMGYYNPIHHFGDKNFIEECHKSGVDGLIIVDLQPENDNKLFKLAKEKNIEFIRLITPTTDTSRLKEILQNASGFLYYVSITGVTGGKLSNFKDLKISIAKIRKKTKLPIVVGFGIKTNQQVKKLLTFADGVVIGSSIVNIIEKYSVKNLNINNILNKIRKYIKSLLRK